MREILFRGKRCNNGEWAEGCLIRDEFCNTDIPYIGYLSDYDIGAVEVTPETVGQFTGLTDKNGKKIFEGDILSENGSLFSVIFDQKWARFRLQYIGRVIQYPEWNRGGQMEVIGNIHDQPELVMPPKGE